MNGAWRRTGRWSKRLKAAGATAGLWAGLITGLVAGGAAAPAAAMDSLPAAARAALQRAGVPEAALTGVAWPLDGWRWGAPWAREADRPVQPGSTMKLLTTAVALERLGPNLRGRTQLLSVAPVVDGVLQGDLVLRGGADPELGWPQLWQLLLELREQGV